MFDYKQLINPNHHHPIHHHSSPLLHLTLVILNWVSHELLKESVTYSTWLANDYSHPLYKIISFFLPYFTSKPTSLKISFGSTLVSGVGCFFGNERRYNSFFLLILTSIFFFSFIPTPIFEVLITGLISTGDASVASRDVFLTKEDSLPANLSFPAPVVLITEHIAHRSSDP